MLHLYPCYTFQSAGRMQYPCYTQHAYESVEICALMPEEKCAVAGNNYKKKASLKKLNGIF